MLISKNGRIHIIERTTGENFRQHINRSWFIVNTKCTVSESRIWQGITEYQCSYSPEIERKITELEKNYQH